MGADQSKEEIFSVVSQNPTRSGCGPTRRSFYSREKLISNSQPEVKTLYDNFQRGLRLNPDGACLGIRLNGETVYKWQSYEKVNERIHNFASGLVAIGLQKGAHVGIFAKNRPEWFIAEQACYAQSMIPIALYDTLGPDAVNFILNHAEISVIICSQDKIPKLLQASTKVPTLKCLIQMEPRGDKEMIKEAEEKQIELHSFAEIEDKGIFKPAEPLKPTPEDIATIMYTSGTTGNPKGVVLKHSNIISAISSADALSLNFKKEDIMISYLPMAHIFERVVQGVLVCWGASIAFYSGDITKLFDDIAICRPTIFPGVPRLFTRMYDKVMQGIMQKGGLSKFLFDYAYSSKTKYLEGGVDPSGSVWDGVVFSQIREKFGGRLRLIVSAAAPITKEVHEFLKIAFSCPVLIGYGLTETCACGAMTLRDNIQTGNAGPPLGSVEIRLEDVPEMKYHVSDSPDPRGEVCIRGPPVFSEYYKNKEETEAVFDKDGFFHTGDIGRWNKDGTLSIIDRKKNIFKLAQGEYVAAEYLEGIFKKSRFVDQIFVYGDSHQVCLVAIVVPDRDVLLGWGKQNQIDTTIEGLCQNEKVKKAVMEDMNKMGKEAKIQGFEFIKAVYLDQEPWTPDNELLTPTLKLKRHQLKQFYQKQIEDMYKSIPQSKN